MPSLHLHSIGWLLSLMMLVSVCPLDAKQPNILLIGIDDLNDWTGCLGGHPQVKTPNIDSLAASGTLFTNAHCQSPLCNPSRTSLMTGRRPSSTGIYALSPWFRNVEKLRNLITLPQAFKKAGYRTAIAGKIYHVFPPARDKAGEFDQYGPPCDFGPFPQKKLVDTPDPIRAMDWGVFPERDEDQNDFHIATWAKKFLSRQKDEDDASPFFLGVGFGRPHVPCFASQQWFDLYPAETLKMPAILEGDRNDISDFAWNLHWKLPEPRLSWLQKSGQWRPLVRAYLASTSFVDSQIGRVMEALRQSGQEDNTLVVLFSDHGWHLGEKAISGKNSLWERSTHVPLIIAGPGVPKQQRCSQPAELLDIYPTLIDLAGVQAVDGLEGLSLRPQVKRPDTPRRPAITTHNPDNHAVRDSRWRYIRLADGSEELYDHSKDPNEWTNLAHAPESKSELQRLRAMLPAHSAPHVKGAAGRVLQKSADGTWLWEGHAIDGDIQAID